MNTLFKYIIKHTVLSILYVFAVLFVVGVAINGIDNTFWIGYDVMLSATIVISFVVAIKFVIKTAVKTLSGHKEIKS